MSVRALEACRPPPRRAPLRSGAATCALLCCVIDLGCSTKSNRRAPPEDAAPPPPAAAVRSSPHLSQLTAPHARAAPAPTVQLPMRESFSVQDAGRAPRSLRRYQLTAGERVYALVARLRARSLGQAHEDRATDVPPFREAFAVRATAGAAGEPMALYWRGEPITIEGDATAAAPYVARWKTLLAGRRARLQLDSAGTLHEIAFAEDRLRQASRPETDELTQRLLGLLVPLPAEPIGVGARWTAITVLRQGLGVVKQTARYELLTATDTHLTIAVDARRVAEEQRVDAPGIPAGAALDLVALFRAVTGRVELELAAPLPVSGALTIEARSHQRLRMPDGATTESITEDLGTLTLTSEPPR